MAQEIGVAYVTLLPSARGFGKAVEGQVGDGFKGADRQSRGFFSRLGAGIKRVAVGVGVVAAGVGAIAIKGGIDRALNIEDAQAKLKGLGHDTKAVEQIMDNALASVKGTAFGLDTAATTAAAAVASGIEPGKELEQYLRLTADAATIAGVSMEEMGSIVNKVQAKGKAQMEDLNRLTERGIPILQMLADEYGVTAEEMSDMVSRGEVDAERFRKALEDNVGGAALSAGDTTRGAFANMRAAMGRFGEALIGDGLGAAKTFFSEVTVIFDGLTDRIGPWVERFQDKLGEMFQIEGMGDRFLDWLDGVVADIQSGPLPYLLEALKPLAPALVELAPAIVELAGPLAELLMAVAPLIPHLTDLLLIIIPLAGDIIEFLVPAVEALAEWVGNSVTAVEDLFGLFEGDTSMATFTSSMIGVGGVAEWMARIFDRVADGFGFLVDTISAGATGIWIAIQTGFNAAVRAVTGAWVRISVSVSSGISRVMSFMGSLPGRISGALAGLGGMLFGVGQNMIRGLINGVSSMISRAVQAVKNVGGAMLEGVQSFLGIQSPSRVFRDEVGKMVGLGLLEGINDPTIGGRIDTAVNHLVSVPEAAVRGRTAEVNQYNTITTVERDPRLMMRQLGRELEVAL